MIPFLKVQNIVEKECLAYFTFIQDNSVEVPFVDSVLVVGELLNMFPMNLPRMPPNGDIHFGINLVSNT